MEILAILALLLIPLFLLGIALSFAIYILEICAIPFIIIGKIIRYIYTAVKWDVSRILRIIRKVYMTYCNWYDRHFKYREHACETHPDYNNNINTYDYGKE